MGGFVCKTKNIQFVHLRVVFKYCFQIFDLDEEWKNATCRQGGNSVADQGKSLLEAGGIFRKEVVFGYIL